MSWVVVAVVAPTYLRLAHGESSEWLVSADGNKECNGRELHDVIFESWVAIAVLSCN